jgi:hypothetical protein
MGGVDVVSRGRGACGLAYLTGPPDFSRAAVLEHRGLGLGDVAAHAGRVWLRITGQGADNAHADRVVTERRLAPC